MLISFSILLFFSAGFHSQMNNIFGIYYLIGGLKRILKIN